MDNLLHSGDSLPHVEDIKRKGSASMKPVKARKIGTPSGKAIKLTTAYACYVNLCEGLGMKVLPDQPGLAREVGLKMRGQQEAITKLTELTDKENRKLRRQISYFSGKSFFTRLAGVFRRPKYDWEEITPDEKKHRYRGMCCHCEYVEPGFHEMTTREAGARGLGNTCYKCGSIGTIGYSAMNPQLVGKVQRVR